MVGTQIALADRVAEITVKSVTSGLVRTTTGIEGQWRTNSLRPLQEKRAPSALNPVTVALLSVSSPAASAAGGATKPAARWLLGAKIQGNPRCVQRAACGWFDLNQLAVAPGAPARSLPGRVQALISLRAGRPRAAAVHAPRRQTDTNRASRVVPRGDSGLPSAGAGSPFPDAHAH